MWECSSQGKQVHLSFSTISCGVWPVFRDYFEKCKEKYLVRERGRSLCSLKCTCCKHFTGIILHLACQSLYSHFASFPSDSALNVLSWTAQHELTSSIVPPAWPWGYFWRKHRFYSELATTFWETLAMLSYHTLSSSFMVVCWIGSCQQVLKGSTGWRAACWERKDSQWFNLAAAEFMFNLSMTLTWVTSMWTRRRCSYVCIYTHWQAALLLFQRFNVSILFKTTADDS